MGFAITWLACAEQRADELLTRLGLSATGEIQETPESDFCMLRLNAQWRIIWIGEYGCSFLSPPEMAKLSSDTDIVMCMVEEHVMASSAERWSNGRRQWWVSHEGEEGPNGIETEGDLPANFAAIRVSMEKAQVDEGGADAEVDFIFEIPLRLAESIVGFKHDAATDGEFEVLTRTKPKSVGLFKKLFGG